MKILTLFMLATLMSLTYGQFECEWPTLKTMDILEQPTVPGFLNDYSAPGQIQWNQQVNWQLNQLNALKEDLEWSNLIMSTTPKRIPNTDTVSIYTEMMILLRYGPNGFGSD